MAQKKDGVRKRVSKKQEAIETPKMKLRHKQSWAILGILFLLSLMTIISLQESGMSITGNAVQTVGFAKAGSTLSFQVSNVPGLNDATAVFNQEIRNGVIKFEVNENIPFENDYYSKFSISSVDEDKITSLKLTLFLEQVKLDQIPLSRNEVQLFQNSLPIETTMSKIEGNRIFYTATITSLGDFVIGRKQTVVKEQVVVKEEPVVIAEPQEQLPAVIQEPLVGDAIQEPVVVKEESKETGFWAWLKSLFN